MIVTDLSTSFNPYPKPDSKTKKSGNGDKTIKNKSNKLAKKEQNRFSILQKNENTCFLCEKYVKKLDKHEAFGGSNRQKSMEWGLIYYLCRICHKKADEDKITRQKLHDYARIKFTKIYGKEKFLIEFKKTYISN